MSNVKIRADRKGIHQAQFNKNRARILATQDTCYICGQLVDKTLPRGNPLAPEVDHIIPVAKLDSNDPRLSSLDNLCLTHAICNRKKGAKTRADKAAEAEINNQSLAWCYDWTEYRTN